MLGGVGLESPRVGRCEVMDGFCGSKKKAFDRAPREIVW